MKLYKRNATAFKKQMDYYMPFLENAINEGRVMNFVNGIINKVHNVDLFDTDPTSIEAVASAACFFKECKERNFKDKVFNKNNFRKIFKAMNAGATGTSSGKFVDLIDLDILSQYDGDPETFKKIEDILPKERVGDESRVDFELAKENGIEIEQYEDEGYEFDWGIDLEELAQENAKNKHKEVKDAIFDDYVSTTETIPGTNVFFDGNFLIDCVKEIKTPQMLNDNEKKNLSGYVKGQLDSAKEELQGDFGKPHRQDACKKRLESYFLLKDKVQKRSWKDILFHPIKSYRESKMLKETESMLKNDYEFSDKLLNNLEKMCIKDREVPKNTYCLKRNGDFVKDEITEEDINKEYERLKKEPRYQEYVYDEKEKGLGEKLAEEFDDLNNSRNSIQSDLESQNEELEKSQDEIERDIS